MPHVSQHQSAQSGGVSNANNVPANGITLPAVPVFQFNLEGKQDLLAPMLSGKLGPFATAIGPEKLADQLEPEKNKRNPVSETALKAVNTLKQFLDSIKKKLGGDVMWEGIAIAFAKDPLTMGDLRQTILAGDTEAHAKQFLGRMKNGGLDGEKGSVTIKKEYNSKNIIGSDIDEAFALYGPGCSFFGNIYVKKYEMEMKQDDPAFGPKPQRTMTDHFEFTVQCAHNSFVIKDDQFPSPPILVKTSGDLSAAMRDHINKNYGYLKNMPESPELQMLMEFNVPLAAQSPMLEKLKILPV